MEPDLIEQRNAAVAALTRAERRLRDLCEAVRVVAHELGTESRNVLGAAKHSDYDGLGNREEWLEMAYENRCLFAQKHAKRLKMALNKAERKTSRAAGSE